MKNNSQNSSLNVICELIVSETVKIYGNINHTALSRDVVLISAARDVLRHGILNTQPFHK